MSLSGKVTLITGGTKNLGAAIASLFAESGSHLALHYNSPSSAKASEEFVKSLKAKYPSLTIKLYHAGGDLSVSSNVSALFSAIAHDFGGKLDVVINTVGKVLKKPFVQITDDEYDSMFAINSKAAFLISQEAAKRVNQGGKIINTVTSLLAGYTGFYASYQGSKAPVEWFTKALSKELMEKGISVNAVAPGPMDTPFFYPQESPEAVAFHKSQAIGGRLTVLDDIAPIYRFLCTEGAWFNGQTLFANGGYTSR